ncbi:unnamed protein product [Effrenium voratum]|uniref:Cyclic nucleotide-binding domain-containing protein n=1 Tax=Effrenium voratum TaxID=2562239 RepID=A0AA36IR37_9DINO|nr:unnamed protein product [Effrenium voratum]
MGEDSPLSPGSPAEQDVQLLSPSAANYVKVKLERLGEVESFRGLSLDPPPPVDLPAQRLAEAALTRLLAYARAPGELATFLATELHVTKLRAKSALCVLGEPADSLFILVDGYARVYSKEIGPVGVLGPGAMVGTTALLGLLHVRTCTVLALQECAVIEVRQDILERTKFRRIKESLLLLAYERCQQSQQLMPMAALPLGIPAGDACGALLGLHAERVDLAPGDVLWPFPDSHPSGPHFSVLVSGTADLEMASGKPITRLRAGSYIPEGLLAENGALVRANSTCLAYRVPQYDLLVTVGSQPECREWYDRCRGLEQQVRQSLLPRLRNAKSDSRSASRTLSSPSRRPAKAPVCVLKAPPVFPVEAIRKSPARRRDPREMRRSASKPEGRLRTPTPGSGARLLRGVWHGT